MMILTNNIAKVGSNFILSLNPVALRMAKTPLSFDRSECNKG